MEKSVFEIVVTDFGLLRRMKPDRRYPHYRVRMWKLGTASSLEQAERMMRIHIAGTNPDFLHSLMINEVPLDRPCTMHTSLSSYLYDRDGTRIDERTYSTIREDDGVYPGRTSEQIRFRKGDIVETLEGNEVTLGFVVELPASAGKAARINESRNGWHLDDTDDSYTILFGSDFTHHKHIDSLRVFAPRLRVHPSTEKRLRKCYSDYVSFPARSAIMNTTALEQLRKFMGSQGMKGQVKAPEYLDDEFRITLELPDGSPTVLVDRNRAYTRMDRVCCTLARIAGIKADGRGFTVRTHSNGDLWF